MEILIENTDKGFSRQINQFAKEIDEPGAAVGLSPEEIQGVKDDALAIKYVYGNQITVKQFYQQHSAYKKILSNGKGNLGNMPVPLIFSTAPTAVAKDIKGRFRALTARMAKHPAFSKPMGEKLGIIAPEIPFDPTQGKPDFEIEYSSAGHPLLVWLKGKFDGVEIWKDSGTGYVKLDRDNSPDYIDKTPLPAIGVSVLWKYKMIYIYKDEVVGMWSSEQEIYVHSEV